MKSSLKLIFIVFLFWLLCACAERREIEELGFVVGAAYDQSSHSAIKGTYQMVLPNTLSSSERGTATQKNYINLSATGESIFAHFRMIAKKLVVLYFSPTYKSSSFLKRYYEHHICYKIFWMYIHVMKR